MTSPLVPPLAIPTPNPPATSYGLLTAAVGPLELPPHGIGGGVQYVSDSCGDAHLYPSVCDATPPVKTFDLQDPTVTGLPFLVYASINCGSMGFSFPEMEARVRRRLLITEQAGVEEALWGANAGDTPGLFQVDPGVTTLPDATTIVAGVAALEQQLAACNTAKVGYIHTRPLVAAYLADHHQVRWDGTVWRTTRGNIVVFGDGYSGLGPAGEAPTPTTEWMYATGRIITWRSNDINVPDPRQTFNRTTNQQFLLAERDWAMVVECCIAAIEVTLV